MDHDALLKSILQSLANVAIPRLVGARPVEQLNVEFTAVKRRLPDLVARLDNGRILHLELQTTNDPHMAQRMLEYWLLLAGRFPGVGILQTVLYVGNAPLRMQRGFELEFLKYQYALHDVREIEAALFLASDSPAERVLAVLCRTRNPRETIRSILRSWSGAPKDQWADLNEKLMLISGLRELEKAVAEEARNMPLTIDIIKNNKVVQEWMEKGKQLGYREGMELGLEQGERLGREIGRELGREEGLQHGLEQGEVALFRRLLERKFGKLPRWANARLKTATPKMIEEWALLVLEADSLEKILR